MAGQALIGGDIQTLHDLVAKLHPVKDAVTVITKRLDDKVEAITGELCWGGSASQAFVRHWTLSAQAASTVAGYCDTTATVLGSLAEELTSLEQQLEMYAAEVTALGIPMPADGSPPPVDAIPADMTPADFGRIRGDYTYIREQILASADNARTRAQQAIAGIASRVATQVDGAVATQVETAMAAAPKGVVLKNTNPLDVPAELDPYRFEKLGLTRAGVTIPAESYGKIPELAEDAKTGLAKAQKALAAAQARNAPYSELYQLRTKISVEQAKLTAFDAATPDSPRFVRSDTLLNTKLGDLHTPSTGVGKVAGKVFGGIPILDVALAGVSTVSETNDRIDAGDSLLKAGAKATAANASSTVANTVVGDAVGTVVADGTVAVLGATGSAFVGVGACVVVGTAVGYGVGKFVGDMVDEHWGTDFNEHGYVGGALVGTGHSLAAAGGDVKDAAVSLWNGVFG